PFEYTGGSSVTLEALSAGISEIIRRLSDGTTLQLIVESRKEHPDAVAAYTRRSSERSLGGGPEHALSADVARHTGELFFRDQEFFLFVSQPYAFQNAALVRAGALPISFPRWSKERYEREISSLRREATSVRDAFSALGIECVEASEDRILSLIEHTLNPFR